MTGVRLGDAHRNGLLRQPAQLAIPHEVAEAPPERPQELRAKAEHLHDVPGGPLNREREEPNHVRANLAIDRTQPIVRFPHRDRLDERHCCLAENAVRVPWTHWTNQEWIRRKLDPPR